MTMTEVAAIPGRASWHVPAYDILFDQGARQSVCVIIPVINEGERIRSLLTRMAALDIGARRHHRRGRRQHRRFAGTGLAAAPWRAHLAAQDRARQAERPAALRVARSRSTRATRAWSPSTATTRMTRKRSAASSMRWARATTSSRPRASLLGMARPRTRRSRATWPSA
ncbi:hypothetical protein LP420_27120 [Massilia sp. B-10]|nr:hypothetical protein LP420_27120 [Massilia sp. B-10]